MKRNAAVIAVVTILMAATGCDAGSDSGEGEGEVPTFHSDVLPILQAKCQSCHRPEEAGPMSLLTYEDARTWAPMIREMIVSERMPPWFSADPPGTFANENRLTSAERRTLLEWVEAETPEGDPSLAPPPREFAEGWAIQEPDHVVELPEAFPVPAEGVIEYQQILIPTGFEEDKWVQSIEVRPTDRAVVHHVQVFVHDFGGDHSGHEHGEFQPSVLDTDLLPEEDDGIGIVAAAGASEQVCVYVPGGSPCVLEDGQARFIPAGADLALILHYQSVGRPVEDRTRIGFRFAEEPPAKRVRNFFLANQGFSIPPGASDVRVTARTTLARPATLIALMPHMHFRGTAFRFRLQYPDGRDEVALDVPHYDPDWQLTYFLAEPRELPAGTTIEAIGTFDNSANNPRNPDPTVEVRWGHQAWDEMHTGFFDLAVPADEDPVDLFETPDF